MNNRCVLTYITGNYDHIIEPKTISPGWDHICVTDSDIESATWNIKPIHVDDTFIKCPKRKANSIVMQYSKYIPETYDICICIDGNMEITDDLNKFIKEFNFDPKEHDLMIGQHPDRNCIYDEAREIIKLKKETPMIVNKHINILKSINYPRNAGLNETGVLVISRKSVNCYNLFSEWYKDYMKLPSKRDQLSFNYTLWKYTQKNGINVIEYERKKNKKYPREKRPFSSYFSIVNHK